MRLIVGFAAAAGFADVVLLKKYGAFPTMMTGNMLKMTDAALAQRWADVTYFASAVVAYIGGAATYRRATATGVRTSLTEPLSTTPRQLAPPVLALFVLADVLTHACSAQRRWCMLPLASGFGIINGVSIGNQRTITNMLTGHMHKLTNLGVDAALSGEPVAFAPGDRHSVGVLGGFVGGAVWGVAVTRRLPGFLTRGCVCALGVVYAALLALTDDAGGLAACRA